MAMVYIAIAIAKQKKNVEIKFIFDSEQNLYNKNYKNTLKTEMFLRNIVPKTHICSSTVKLLTEKKQTHNNNINYCFSSIAHENKTVNRKELHFIISLISNAL